MHIHITQIPTDYFFSRHALDQVAQRTFLEKFLHLVDVPLQCAAVELSLGSPLPHHAQPHRARQGEQSRHATLVTHSHQSRSHTHNNHSAIRLKHSQITLRIKKKCKTYLQLSICKITETENPYHL